MNTPKHHSDLYQDKDTDTSTDVFHTVKEVGDPDVFALRQKTTCVSEVAALEMKSGNCKSSFSSLLTPSTPKATLVPTKQCFENMKISAFIERIPPPPIISTQNQLGQQRRREIEETMKSEQLIFDSIFTTIGEDHDQTNKRHVFKKKITRNTLDHKEEINLQSQDALAVFLRALLSEKCESHLQGLASLLVYISLDDFVDSSGTSTHKLLSHHIESHARNDPGNGSSHVDTRWHNASASTNDTMISPQRTPQQITPRLILRQDQALHLSQYQFLPNSPS